MGGRFAKRIRRARKRLASPRWVKTDSEGKPMSMKDAGMNRKDRRKLQRETRMVA